MNRYVNIRMTERQARSALVVIGGEIECTERPDQSLIRAWEQIRNALRDMNGRER